MKNTQIDKNFQPSGFKYIVFLFIKIKLWFSFRILFPLKLWLLEFKYNIQKISPRKLFQQIKDKESWKRFFINIYSTIERIETKIKNTLENHPRFSTAIIIVLFIGILPLAWQFYRRANIYFVNSQNKNVTSTLKQAKALEVKDKDSIASDKYLSAFISKPKSFNANYEMALFFIRQKEINLAEKNIQFLSQLYPGRIEVIALKGISDLYKGNYQRAEDKLLYSYKNGLEEDWVIDNYAISLVANGKTKIASQLAGWPDDCEANSVSHALCMQRIANWHKEVKDIENNLKRCPVTENKSLHHQQREIIYLGESLRTFRRAIEETDGLYKKHLIKQYNSAKKILRYSHAKLIRNKYLDKNKAAYNSLTQYEKALNI